MKRVDSALPYLEELGKRGKKSHAYTPHQLAGLEIADMLGDLAHKSLYIKLAKIHGKDRLFRIAKTILEKKDVRNPGAYFMTVLKQTITK